MDATGYTADRAFVLSDQQVFVVPTQAFPGGSFRQVFQDFRHDQQFWNVRAVVGNEARIAGLRNRASLGAEHNRTRFTTLRQQTGAGRLPPIDVRDPQPFTVVPRAGFYDSLDVTFRSRLRQTAVFAEDALNLTPRWLLVGGVRWDHIALDRTTIQNASGGIDRNAPTYDPVTWRAGSTWEAVPGVTLYAQHTTAVTPVSSILLSSVANTRFRLTSGRAWEGGVKASAWGGRAVLTAAAYRIAQKDIVTRDPANPAVAVQGGRQSSQGVELTAALSPLLALRLTGGFSYTDAQYDELGESVGGVRVDRAGNRPINVPTTTADAGALYTIGSAVTLGGFVRHVGGFYTDTANTILVRGRTVVDASIAWRVDPQATLTLRGRNLTDAFYGEYSGYPTTNVYIGAPRSFEVALATRF